MDVKLLKVVWQVDQLAGVHACSRLQESDDISGLKLHRSMLPRLQ